MSGELQLGKYEFYPYDEKIQHLLDELLPTDEERENCNQETSKEEKREKRERRQGTKKTRSLR